MNLLFRIFIGSVFIHTTDKKPSVSVTPSFNSLILKNVMIKLMNLGNRFGN